MKAKKRLIALVSSIGILGIAETAYAADVKSPADIAADLTRKSITKINTDRAAGKTMDIWFFSCWYCNFIYNSTFA
ncbi:hypothetical protein [Desulfitobacterium sp. AusDCA]|uniref:hypothetical protein n=1 Tax=Desulfitobacterium sp. AusDCA TaxID=3240383 RepID=UPI003DA76095